MCVFRTAEINLPFWEATIPGPVQPVVDRGLAQIILELAIQRCLFLLTPPPEDFLPPPLIDKYYALPEGHCNWRGGLWPHGNYTVAHGLQRYGFMKEARSLAMKTYEVAAADPDIYEWYDAESGKPKGAHPLAAGVEVLMRFLPTELETDFNPALLEDAGKPLENGRLRKALFIQEDFRKP